MSDNNDMNVESYNQLQYLDIAADMVARSIFALNKDEKMRHVALALFLQRLLVRAKDPASAAKAMRLVADEGDRMAKGAKP